MFYILFKVFHLTLAFEYSQNFDEIKVHDFHTPGLDEYDSLKEKFISFSLGIDLTGQEILQVISKYTPFDDEQRVDVLTNCSNVYTIQYHKYFKGKNSSQKHNFKYAESCSSIAYLGDQFAIFCSKPFNQIFLQNGTSIPFQNSIFSIKQIQSFFGGLAILLENSIIIYDGMFNFENQIQLYYIQLITTESQAYILTQENVFKFYSSGQSLQYIHHCKSQPLFMEIIQSNIYVKCEKIIYFINQTPYSNSIQAESLKSTFQYLIIDSVQIYDITIQYKYYESITPLYPINFDNQVLTIKDNVLFVGKIIGLYLINVNQTIKLKYGTIFTVGPDLENLHQEESYIMREEKIFYFLNYLSGPDIQLIDGAVSFETKKIKIQKNILTALFVSQNTLVFIDKSEENILSINLCTVQIFQNEVQKQCESQRKLRLIPNIITKARSGKYNPENAIIVFVLENNILRSFTLDHTFDEIYDVLDFYFAYSILVVAKKSSTILYSIYYEQQYMIGYFNFASYGAAISETELTLLIENNTLITLKYSIDGLFKSYEEQFTEKIININYVQNQLLVTLKDKILVYEKQILRGKVDLDIIGNIQFVQTERNLYVYNQTTVYVFQIYKEISLSSYLQQVIVVEEEINKLQAISFNEYELLLINQDLYILEALKTFQLISIVDDDQFAKLINYKINFVNRYNQTAELQFKKYGDTLKLKVLNCNETFEINKIEVNKIFDGPITRVEGSHNIKILQRVKEKITKSFWVNNKVSEVFPLPLNGQKIVITNYNEINLCDQSLCQTLIKTIPKCSHFEDDYLYFYIMCGSLIYRGLKEAPQKFEQLPFVLDELNAYRAQFNNNLIFEYKSKDGEAGWVVYQDYKLKGKLNQEIIRFVYDSNKIIALTQNKLIILDMNLIEIGNYQIFLLLQEQQFEFENEQLKLENIVRIQDNQYIITTSDLLILEILLYSNYLEVSRIFTSPHQIQKRKLLLIDSTTFALIGFNFFQGEYYIAFYDLRSQKPISSYFQILIFSNKSFKYSIKVKVSAEHELFVFMIDEEIKEFIVQDYIQIENTYEIPNSLESIEIIAYDLNKQVQKSIVKIKPSVTEKEYNIKYTLIKIICSIVSIIFFLLIVRQTRRYFLSKQLEKNKLIPQNNQQF